MESLAILFHIGPFGITRTVVTSWGILLLLGFGKGKAAPVEGEPASRKIP